MLKILLLFLLFIISFRNYFSQNNFFISIKGDALSSKNKEKLFGALIYFMKKDVLISKTVSGSDGSFLLSANIAKGDIYDLIVFKNGFIDKKILFDLTNVNLSDQKQKTITLKNPLNIVLFTKDSIGDTQTLDSVYSEKYTWDQENFQFIEDENYRLQFEDMLKLSNSDKSKMLLSSSEIELLDKNISSEFLVLSKQAKLFVKEKKFKPAYEKYEEAERLLAKLSDTKSKNLYLSELKIDKNKMLELKNSEEQVFKIQLLKATEYYSQGPNFYAKAKSILITDPMKSRVNDPEVMALIDKIDKMEVYFNTKDAAYRLVKTKNKNSEAIILLQKTQQLSLLNEKLVYANDFTQLNKSIDSLQIVINPKLSLKSNSLIPASTADQGTIIGSPEEIITEIDNDAYNDIVKNIEKNKNTLIYKKEAIQNDSENNIYISNVLFSARNQDIQLSIAEQKNEVDKLSMNRTEMLNTQQLKVQSAIRDSEEGINQNNSRVQAKKDLTNSMISINKDEADLSYLKKNDQTFLRQENTITAIQNQQDSILINSDIVKKSQESRITKQVLDLNSIDYTIYQKDSLFKVQSNLLANKIEDQKYFNYSYETKPNYLKNVAGDLFERNKMTEVSVIKNNSEGFVSTVILRRVVVDMNGYGVVYEQITNENGKIFFTKNGLPISETIWFNESTGVNVIKK